MPHSADPLSLVFQLVEFARNLVTLLSRHLALPNSDPIETSFPTAEQVTQSEAEWARQRAQFDRDSNEHVTPIETNTAIPIPVAVAVVDPDSPGSAYGLMGMGGLKEMRIDEEGMQMEARALDEAMRLRKVGRA